jgi:hypothetical protein
MVRCGPELPPRYCPWSTKPAFRYAASPAGLRSFTDRTTPAWPPPCLAVSFAAASTAAAAASVPSPEPWHRRSMRNPLRSHAEWSSGQPASRAAPAWSVSTPTAVPADSMTYGRRERSARPARAMRSGSPTKSSCPGANSRRATAPSWMAHASGPRSSRGMSQTDWPVTFSWTAFRCPPPAHSRPAGPQDPST